MSDGLSCPRRPRFVALQCTKHKNTSIKVLEHEPIKTLRGPLDEGQGIDEPDLESPIQRDAQRRRAAGRGRPSLLRTAERAHEAAKLSDVANQKWHDTDYQCSGLELLIELLHMRNAVIQLHTLKVSWRFCTLSLVLALTRAVLYSGT